MSIYDDYTPQRLMPISKADLDNIKNELEKKIENVREAGNSNTMELARGIGTNQTTIEFSIWVLFIAVVINTIMMLFVVYKIW